MTSLPGAIVRLTLLAATLLAGGGALRAEPIDMANPLAYAGQPVPAYITKDNTTPGNPITNKGATLGRVLFYDKRLSTNDTISCASCHQQSKGFGDSLTPSPGVNGLTGRHTMRLINARFARERRFFWDERAATLEAQTTQPIRNHDEMGFSGQSGAPTFNDLLVKMQATPYYPYLFAQVYGDPAITEDRMQRALAQFIRSIQSFDSRYDTGRAAAPNEGAPFANFTPGENAGKQLFLQPPVFNPSGVRIGGGAGCAGCHQPPEFDIDPASLSNGVIGQIGGGQDLTNTRSPSLRDMVDASGNLHGGLMHTGGFVSLNAAVQHYNAVPPIVTQPGIAPSIDPRVRPAGNPQQLALTVQELNDIVAFMRTLRGTNVYTDTRWSNPFDASGNLTVVGLGADVADWNAY